MNRTTNDGGMVARVRQWWDDGTILLTLGWSVLLTIVLDRYLQHQLLRDTTPLFGGSRGGGGGAGGEVPLDKEEMIQEIVYSAQQQRRLLYQQYRTAPTLYQGKVIRYYKMGGSHGLYNIQLGDIVDVLEENVGPQQAYHLCRFVRKPNADEMKTGTTTTKSTTTGTSTSTSTTPLQPQSHHHPLSHKNTTTTNPMIHNTNEQGDIIELGWYPKTHLEIYVPPRSWWRRLLFG
jgi:hypothetical protein